MRCAKFLSHPKLLKAQQMKRKSNTTDIAREAGLLATMIIAAKRAPNRRVGSRIAAQARRELKELTR